MIVNSANMNSVPINRIVINTVGGIGNKNNNNIPALSPIASYRNYDRTNDDEDRDMLIDLTGNGHHIKLYNFLFGGNSGYGKYKVDFKDWNTYAGRGETTITSSSIHITNVKDVSSIAECPISTQLPSYKIKVSGLNNSGKTLRYRVEKSIENVPYFNITKDGIYNLPAATIVTEYQGAFFVDTIGDCDITIEQIPYYKGALVSDGVDDYGLCETVYGNIGTVIALLDASNWENEKYLYNAGTGEKRLYCWKNSNGVIINGLPADTNTQIGMFNVYRRTPQVLDYPFNLFSYSKSSNCVSIAFYALKIYNRDLTDEEIEKEKAKMIKRYKDKTGEKYTE